MIIYNDTGFLRNSEFQFATQNSFSVAVPFSGLQASKGFLIILIMTTVQRLSTYEYSISNLPLLATAQQFRLQLLPYFFAALRAYSRLLLQGATVAVCCTDSFCTRRGMSGASVHISSSLPSTTFSAPHPCDIPCAPS